MAHKWPEATPQHLPRWRGFNLLHKFMVHQQRQFDEADFQLIAELGFNFVRLPMDYRCWIKNGNWEQFNDEALREIDDAVEWGRQYGIHVCFNFHRAPGYTVARPAEARSIWTDAEALRVCVAHWTMFASLFRGIPSSLISFNLMNEPDNIEPAVYEPVVRALTAAIHAEDPGRLIIADGLLWGNRPVPELQPLGIAQATRGYLPMEISHYRASWVAGADTMPIPTWPLRDADGAGRDKDRQWLWETAIEPWKKLEQAGVAVMVGEWGAFNQTPHDVVLRWMEDCLANWQQAGWGWALWNFAGSFGVLDSGRSDVAYEDWKGHKLDREMLDLLQRY